MLNTQNKIVKVFNLLIPFYYVAIGIILLTNYFAEYPENARTAFGVIIIFYGLFRVCRIFLNRQAVE